MSKQQSGYADTPSSYEFPPRYLKWFEPLSRGEPMLAILYEPRDGGQGRQAFVGWASISSPPRLSPRKGTGGQPLWEVAYSDYVHEFASPVRRDIAGEPIEAWLRAVPQEHRDIRTSGMSVRPLSDHDLSTILRLGFSDADDMAFVYPEQVIERPALPVAERARHLVSTLERASWFREGVVRAYEFQCAVSRFTAGAVPRGRVSALVDAAHIRPVSDRGPDMLSNGIALTPTVHRLFDGGLFTVRSSSDGGLEVQTSPRLTQRMIESPDGASRIELADGVRLVLPSDRTSWPSLEQIQYHQRKVYQGELPGP